ncbi:MAG: helix-turn-helix domain-containing protein [Pleurocapsa sp. CRU_1_2]|nr:helix-turn-helix domain-containing protein [Pleurocapsa sp. CRU_1_2]
MVKIEIAETTTELEKLLRLVEFVEVRERIQVIYWIKSDRVKTVTAISLLLGKHRTTISRWLNIYRAQGLKALLTKEKSSGRNKKITPLIEQSLKKSYKTQSNFIAIKKHIYGLKRAWYRNKLYGSSPAYTLSLKRKIEYFCYCSSNQYSRNKQDLKIFLRVVTNLIKIQIKLRCI